MAYSEAQKKATAKYMKNNLDEIKIRVAKGKKQIIQGISRQVGKSTNEYIKNAIQDKIKADTGKEIEL